MEEEEKIREQVFKNTLEEAKVNAGGEEGQADPCVICLESISERAATSPCRHASFDFLCILSWLQERSTCPLCNAEVLSLEYDWKSPKDFKVYQVSQPKKRKRADAAPDIIHRNVRPEYRGRPRPSWRTQGPRTQAPVRADAALVRRRFRELTPQLLARDEELISRARKWIRRELQVFEFLSSDGREGEGVTMRGNNAEFLLEYIIAILKTVDIKGSGGQAEDMLQEFLGRDHTKLFLHELKAWLRSPYASLQDWDRHVQYDETTAIAAKDKG